MVLPRPAPPGAPSTGSLGDVLGDPALKAEKRNAFATLYERWGLEYKDGEAGCDARRLGGHECVFRTGTWKKLRRFNVPVILELSSPTGERRYATIIRLGRDEATLDFGGRVITVSLADIDRFWEGSFIALWKPPPGPVPIQPGARGRQVEWVRSRLARVDGDRGAPGTGEIYDEALARRVTAFQRSLALSADGLIGVETALQLAAAAREPGIPWLSDPRP
jgi:general secretion pathway protein A